jgi:hypothetical protein
MIFISVKEDLAAKVAGFDREATLSVALWILAIGVVDIHKIRRSGNHSRLEHLAKQLLLVEVTGNHGLNPVVGNGES